MFRQLIPVEFKRTCIDWVQRLLLKRNLFLTSSMMAHLRRERLFKITNRMDYVRLSCLELFAYECKIEGYQGDVAEVGVYQGEFALKIQEAFPDRMCYLYDTFEGFDAKDENFDRQQGYYSDNDDFSNTSVERVLQKMPFPDRCIIRKGRFPETAQESDGPFVFVSLDADLYLPTIAGLRFFFPKLCAGGMIFVHDFSGPGYAGIRQAVVEFCCEQKLGFVQLSDTAGSAAIRKPLA